MTNISDLFDLPADEKPEFEKLPAGSYQCEIQEALVDEDGQWGPQLKYTLKVCEESNFKNRKLWVNRKLTPNLMWKVRKDLNAFGYADVSSKNYTTVLEALPGKTVTIDLAYGDNQKNPAKPYQIIEFVERSATGSEIPF